MVTIDLTVAIIGAIFTFAAFIVGIAQLWVAIYPVWKEHKNRQILNEDFSRGPYDQATIERATRYYIRPKSLDIDPAQEQELRHVLMAMSGDLFEKVDQFLTHNDPRKHLLILADSGTGKTSFVLNYYAYNSSRVKTKRHNISVIPLGIKNADDLIDKIQGQTEKVIILDAFDEDVKAISDHRERLSFLMEKCRNFKKVIITCRTQFFPKNEEVPVETGVAKVGPRGAGEKMFYEFWKLYLSPFDDNDVKSYISKRYPVWRFAERKKALAIALRVPLLSVRPMLLAHIPEIVRNPIKIEYAYQIYEIMINAWMERESNWVDKNALQQFSQKLAVNFFLNRESRGSEGIPYSELSTLANAWGIKLENWQLGGRSLLNRDAEDNFKFAHRSIMEYLFVKALLFGQGITNNLGENVANNPMFITDQMKVFISEILGYSSLLRILFTALPDNQKYSFPNIDGVSNFTNESARLIQDYTYIPDIVRQIFRADEIDKQMVKTQLNEYLIVLKNMSREDHLREFSLARVKYIAILMEKLFPPRPQPVYHPIGAIKNIELTEKFILLIQKICFIHSFNILALDYYEKQHLLYPRVIVSPADNNYQDLVIIVSRNELRRKLRHRQ